MDLLRGSSGENVTATSAWAKGYQTGEPVPIYFLRISSQTRHVARGWGRSEEDLGAEKEEAREEKGASRGTRRDAMLEARRRSLELSLARIKEQLDKTPTPARRQALEAARAELTQQLARLT
jgi:hypothetical protein